MTKFEEEFDEKIMPHKDNLDLMKVRKHFKDWHSDEQFQKLLEQNADWSQECKNINQINSQLTKENEDLKSQLQQQALPVVPEDVAKLPPFDDMKEYVLDERLLTIREFLNKLDDKSNSDITEAEAWCMIHEDIAYRAMLDGYTVEKPQLFYLKNKLTTSYLALDTNTGYYEHWGEEIIPKSPIKQGYKIAFTQQEIDSMETGSYEQIEVTE